jgi:hypothetical protein
MVKISTESSKRTRDQERHIPKKYFKMYIATVAIGSPEQLLTALTAPEATSPARSPMYVIPIMVSLSPGKAIPEKCHSKPPPAPVRYNQKGCKSRITGKIVPLETLYILRV